MYVMDQQKRWEEFFPLVEFAYNNSYQSTIKMVPFEFLYGRPCQTPLSWDRLEDRVLVGPEVIQEMEYQMKNNKTKDQRSTGSKKSYVDAHRVDRSYEVGDQVFLRVKPHKSFDQVWKGC
jgi:hypothetical protein